MFAEMMTYTYKSNLMMMKLNQGKVEKAQAPSQPQASTAVLSWRRKRGEGVTSLRQDSADINGK